MFSFKLLSPSHDFDKQGAKRRPPISWGSTSNQSELVRAFAGSLQKNASSVTSYRKSSPHSILEHVNHLLAPAGIEKPLVMKSVFFPSMAFWDEKRALTLSLACSFLCLFLFPCSASTFDVNEAVSALPMLSIVCFNGRPSWAMVTAASESDKPAFFLFLLPDESFLRECESPLAFKFCSRCSSLSFSP